MFKYLALYILFCSRGVFLQNIKYNCENSDGSRGLCTEIEYCDNAKITIGKIRPRPTICGNLDDPKGPLVICCTDVNSYLKKETNTIHFPGMEISQKKCLDFTRERQRLNILSGKENQAIGCPEKMITPQFYGSGGIKLCYSQYFIMGGMDADIDEFPHMALLGWEKVDGTGIDWKCGGSLISENYVLTAAHCVFIDDSSLKIPEPTTIGLGGRNPTIINISSIIVHPNYHPPKKYNDIALIKLEQPVEFTLQFFPACLWNNPQVQGSATAIGWGTTSSGGDRAKALQKVTLNIYTEELCKTGYSISRSQPEGIQNTQFCAGYQLGGRDACQGDSGGPIQTVNTINQEMFDVIGITSFGAGCGSSKGGVYTRISSYLEWIEKIVWPNAMMF